MTAPVTLSMADSVATITIRRPERANALRPQDFAELARLLLAAQDAAECDAIVLTGEGDRAFCAGADLTGGPAFHDDEGRTGLGDVMRAAWATTKPLVARVNGACIGGGMGLLGLCDGAVAVSGARFAMPEITLGFFPHVALCGWRDHRAAARVEAMAASGESLDAPAALAHRLIDAVAARDDIDAALHALLRRIGAGPSLRRSAQATERFRDALTAAEALLRAARRSGVSSAPLRAQEPA